MKREVLLLSIIQTLTTANLGTARAARAKNEPVPAVVQIQNGPIRGELHNGVSEFLGIPFAAPPIGELRWRPPQPYEQKWSEAKSMVTYGETCAQTNTLAGFAAKSQSENCLFLNIFASPGKLAGRKIPVMVWVHGGGLFDGESNDYDGSMLAKQGGVVVVTINYRLNVFGFLALPGLDNEGHPFANYGLMDQQFALRWVHNNISAFGGDADNVTIFGQSAGGQSVLANVVSPTARGLFHRAIIESGSKVLLLSDIASAEAYGEALAGLVGCGGHTPAQTVSCLRALSVETIQARALKLASSNPVVTIDGMTLTQSFQQAFSTGAFNRVPVIDGTNLDEYRFSAALAELATGKVMQPEQYSTAVRDGYALLPGFGTNTASIQSHYPLTSYSSTSVAYSALGTDAFFNSPCAALRLDRALSRYVPVYIYEFADRNAPSYLHPVSFPYGAYHTAELQYLFAGYHGAGGSIHALTPSQQQLSKVMVGYWTDFAKYGNPNGSGLPFWPEYTPTSDNVLQALVSPKPGSVDISAISKYHQCELWDDMDAGDQAPKFTRP